MSLMPRASRTTSRGVPMARASAACISAWKCTAFAYQSRGREEHDQHARELFGAFVGAERRPTRRAGDTAEDVELGTGAEAGSVEDGKSHSRGDALFDADEGDDEQRDHSQPELDPVNWAIERRTCRWKMRVAI